MKVAIITISDRSFKGEREDLSGEIIKKILVAENLSVIKKTIVPDEYDLIRKEILKIHKEYKPNLIITTGGTGISNRDITPEAVKPLLEKELPGIAEIIRIEGFKNNPFSLLSRCICGIYNKTIILTLPGSPNAVKEALFLTLPALKHASDILHNKIKNCHK